jgi:hypothetical protein
VDRRDDPFRVRELVRRMNGRSGQIDERVGEIVVVTTSGVVYAYRFMKKRPSDQIVNAGGPNGPNGLQA